MTASDTPAARLAARIRQVRRERVALVAFLTAGYPSRERFRQDLADVASQADVVEVGIPFTDPMADGVTIQRSSFAALAQGVSLHWILDELTALKGQLEAPLVLMGYFNPLLAYGLERVAARAAEAGVAGFIVPDLPPEESGDFARALQAHGLAMIRMVTPVTPAERLGRICRDAEGFVYAVTMTGTTGANASGGGVALPAESLDYLRRVRELSPVPVCAGFGIRSHAQVQLLDAHVDGVIVGSALVEALEKGESAATLLRGLRTGTS